MAQLITCPQGHHWEAEKADAETSLICPECGALGSLSKATHKAGTINQSQDTGAYASHVTFTKTAGPRRPVSMDPVKIPGYEVLEVLGRGGMGVVYKARHLKLKRLAALKMILSGDHAGPEDIERFRLEAEAIARLQHPNIVQIHEVGEFEGRPYFALEYMDGGSLREKLAGTPLPPRDAAHLTETLARAMQLAHEHGVIHRDLKPANVLLTNDDLPKITDFGLAKQMGEESGRTHTGQIMGTPCYMAPEQAAGDVKAIGPACDIYALGAILYEMLTGRPPFKAASVVDTLDFVRHQEPVPPSQLQPKTPRDLETICLKCLQKEPGKRYVTAKELADDLQRFLNGEPVHARPVGKFERLERWCRRNPAVAALSAAVVAVLLIGSAVAWYLAIDAMQEKGRADASALKSDVNAATAKKNELLAKANADDANKQRQFAEMNEAIAEKNRLLADERREQAETLALRVQFEHYLSRTDDRPDLTLVGLASLLPKASRLKDPSFADSLRLHVGAWSQRTHRLIRIGEHQGEAEVIALSADGRTALTPDGKTTARLWDTATGRPIGPPLEQQGIILAVALSADGKIALTGSLDRAVRLWDGATGKPLMLPLQHQQNVLAATLSADGMIALTGCSDGTAHRWDTATGKPIGPPLKMQGRVTRVVLSADGKIAFTANHGSSAQIWKTVTGEPIGEPLQHAQKISSVALSADGKTALTGSLDMTARLWDTATGKPIGAPLAHEGIVYAVALSANGATAVTAGSGPSHTARLWNTTTGKVIGTLHHPDVVVAVDLSADGKIALTGNLDKSAQLWDTATARPIGLPLRHPRMLAAVALSADGKTLLTASRDKSFRIWGKAGDNYYGTLLAHQKEVDAVALCADGKLALTGSRDGMAMLWDTGAGKPIGQPLLHKHRFASVALSADGKVGLTLLAAHGGDTARLWDLANGKSNGDALPHSAAVVAVALSSDGKTALTGSQDKAARLWETSAVQPIGSPLLLQGRVSAVALSADGKMALTGTLDGIAQIWDCATGKPIGAPIPHPDRITTVALSADGKLALTASNDKVAQLWDTATGKPIGPPLRHPAVVHQIGLSGDGKTALTSCSDRTARLWETATSKQIGPAEATLLRSVSDRPVIALSADAKTALVGTADNMARIWHVPQPLPGEPERILLWSQVLTGLEVDELTAARVLDAATWEQRRQRLQELGGPPKLD